MSELQRSINDKLPTSQQLWNSICTTADVKGLKLTPPMWQAMNTLDSPASECAFCVCSLTQPSTFTDAPFSTNPPTPLPHVPPLPTTPSLSTLLSVVLPQCSLCCASYNIKSLWFTSPQCWSRFPSQSMIIFHQAFFTSETVSCRVRWEQSSPHTVVGWWCAAGGRRSCSTGPDLS